MTLELLFLHLKDNKRGRVTVEVITALFLFLLQLVPMGIIRFIASQGEEISNANESGGNNPGHGDI